MKEQMKAFLNDDVDLQWELSGQQFEILEKAIDKFFAMYQPERLNPEASEGGCDSLNTMET